MAGNIKRRRPPPSETTSLKSQPEVAAPDKPPPTQRSRWSRLSGATINRIIFRMAVLCGALLVYLYNKQTKIHLVKVSETIGKRSQGVDCSQKFAEEIAQFPGCVPTSCGRVISDRVVMEMEAHTLKAIAMKAFAITGGSAGGASILDLHTGALSKGDKFVNVYKLPHAEKLVSRADLSLYKSVRERISQLIAEHFGLSPSALHLTQPTFFSRITAAPARTVHDEYWHVHVDKETYPSFHYTSLLYLSDFDSDFKGGEFVFNDPDGNRTVEPRLGRVSAFTSGWENAHHVEPVIEGARFAITVSFTCNASLAIVDPTQQ